ncbi:CP [Botrytis cinerea alpha-like virus 1]|uniref:CP n=1 Tax=Botrytis cinerea alpha-like virus 1 TaxID=2735873 RepID=A0A858YAV3_9VIRU|nr:CP [Botrytis cinerea alpha-like virus 1]
MEFLAQFGLGIDIDFSTVNLHVGGRAIENDEIDTVASEPSADLVNDDVKAVEISPVGKGVVNDNSQGGDDDLTVKTESNKNVKMLENDKILDVDSKSEQNDVVNNKLSLDVNVSPVSMNESIPRTPETALSELVYGGNMFSPNFISVAKGHYVEIDKEARNILNLLLHRTNGASTRLAQIMCSEDVVILKDKITKFNKTKMLMYPGVHKLDLNSMHSKEIYYFYLSRTEF